MVMVYTYHTNNGDMKKMIKTTEKQTQTKVTIELTADEIIDLIKSSLELTGSVNVDFDVSSAGFLRGALVVSTYTVLHK